MPVRVPARPRRRPVASTVPVPKRRTDWSASRRTESQYYRDIMSMLAQYFDRYTGGFGSESLGQVATIPEWLDAFAYSAARRMITGVYVAAGRTWQDVAWRSTNGMLMYRALRHDLRGPVGARFDQLVRQNASLISSLPATVAELVTVRVARHEQSGERARGVVFSLLEHVARTRAQLIARTETSKATTALTQARSEFLGLDWYIWRTSHDIRVRPAHRLMEGVIVPWSDPPSPERLAGERRPPAGYPAGGIYSCRCGPEPFIDLSQVSWPARVYYRESIRRFTLHQFKRLSGITMYTPVPVPSTPSPTAAHAA